MMRVSRVLLVGCYKQGQINSANKSREYFYTIDHHGHLFLDDARIKNFTSCFKETKFLRFFFSRIRASTPTDLVNHPEFKFVSDCGVEKNFIRVDATPFVFTSLEDTAFGYNNTGFNQEFRPESLYVGSDGRLYHGFKHKAVGFGLVKSSLADLISRSFEYDGEVPVGFRSKSGD